MRRDYAREAIGTASKDNKQIYGLGRKVDKKRKTVAQNNEIIYHGVKPNINDIAKHTMQRQSERGVSIDDIKDTIENPLQVSDIRKDGTYRIIGEHVTIGVSATTGKITTTWRTGSSTKEKIRKGKNK